MSRSKYGNTRCEWNGNVYRSKREMERHKELLLMEKAGLIKDLWREQSFELVRSVKFQGAARATPALRYVADFTYFQDGRDVVEDCKGVRTPVYKIKRHLMLALLGIEVIET